MSYTWSVINIIIYDLISFLIAVLWYKHGKIQHITIAVCPPLLLLMKCPAKLCNTVIDEDRFNLLGQPWTEAIPLI